MCSDIDICYFVFVLQRKNEFSETAQRLAQSAFGEQKAEMIEIRGLAVSTKRQRRGWGTALVDAIHAIVRGLVYHQEVLTETC